MNWPTAESGTVAFDLGTDAILLCSCLYCMKFMVAWTHYVYVSTNLCCCCLFCHLQLQFSLPPVCWHWHSLALWFFFFWVDLQLHQFLPWGASETSLSTIIRAAEMRVQLTLAIFYSSGYFCKIFQRQQDIWHTQGYCHLPDTQHRTCWLWSWMSNTFSSKSYVIFPCTSSS